MSDTSTGQVESGTVLALEPGGSRVVVHQDQGGEYELIHIHEFFQLGEPERDASGRGVLTFDSSSLMKLKALADAYSFDYEEGLILLCLDLHRYALANPRESYSFLDDL